MVTARILVADDHEVVRKGIRAILEAHSGWEVCGEAVDGRDAVEKAEALKPDVVIIDIGMPLLNGLDATRQILKQRAATKVLVLTMHESEQVVQQVLEAGARGYLLKSDASRDLLNAVEELKRNSTKEVAVALDLSVKTAETHRSNIMRKLDIHSISELVLYAVRNNIVQVMPPLNVLSLNERQS